jgi:hypothetical protein
MHIMLRRHLLLFLLPLLALGAASCDNAPIDAGAVDNAITVSSRTTPDNGRITISKVTSTQTGWLVIRRDNGNGGPLLSGYIGKVAIPVGASSNVSVPISPDVELSDGQKLWATLHVDDGENGVFEYTGAGSPDQPAVDSTGAEVTVSFTISQTNPAVTVNNQVPSNGSVVLNVAAAENGWIVVYSSDLSGNPDMMLGYSPVDGGGNKSVTVKLDTAAAKAIKAGDKLWGVLHVDRGTEGTFEFPGADFEVKVGGNVVRSSFSINPATPTVLATPKQIVSGAISIDRVDAKGPSWIVIHETDANGDPILNASIGRARVTIGTNEAVKIQLDKSLPAGTLLAAVLHADDEPIGRYDYIGGSSPDAPVIDQGTSSPVMFQFKIIQ